MEYELVPYFHEEKLKKKFLEKVKKKTEPYEKIGVCYLIQRKIQAQELCESMEKAFMCGQVLGCNMTNVLKYKGEAHAFLLVGSGRFHGIEMKRVSEKPVFVAVPNQEIFEIGDKELARMQGIKTRFTIDFHRSKNIGLLVSTKKGQFNLERAKKAKRKLEKSGKNAYIFLFDTLVPEDLENFSGIDFWINFACPRMPEDYERFPRPVLNWKEIEHECD